MGEGNPEATNINYRAYQKRGKREKLKRFNQRNVLPIR